MCGIAGIVRWGDKPIEEETIGILLVGNEHRGNDASGIALQQADGSISILKKDVPGWTLVGSHEYTTFIRDHLKPDTRCALIHARGASQGNPRDNNNNHPMYAGKAAIIHNGVIRNDKWLFEQLKLERKADTDSDVIRAIVDEFGFRETTMQQLGRASGSGAIAAIHPEYPDKLMLIRSGNPLVLASNEDFFFFSSEKNTLHKACRPFVERKGIWFQAQKPDVAFTNMPDNTGWILSLGGIELKRPCQISGGNFSEPWRKTYEEYAKRQAKWDAATQKQGVEERKDAWCHTCNKMWLIPKDGQYMNFNCPKEKKGCGGRLWPPPEFRVKKEKVN